MLIFFRIERTTPVLIPAVQLNESFLCNLRSGSYRGGGGTDDQVVNRKRAADGRRQRSRKIID